MRKELQLHATPTIDLQIEVAKLGSFLRGLRWALDRIEIEQNNSDLPIFGDQEVREAV
jgi:hypothetical protein